LIGCFNLALYSYASFSVGGHYLGMGLAMGLAGVRAAFGRCIKLAFILRLLLRT